MTSSSSKIFYLVAGEASGDILGAGLISSLKKRYPNSVFKGIGGPLMQKEGLDTFYPYERLAVMGIVPILLRFYELIKMRNRLRDQIIADKPDCFIGIDSPVFNTNLEYQLTRKGVCCAHYVSPSVWAWRENRIHKIVKSVRLMLCLFPFELEIYQKHQLKAVNVGHPLADEIPLEPNLNQARETLNIDQDADVLAILPGSRGSEAKFLLEPFLKAAKILYDENPGLNFVIPCANASRRNQIESYILDNSIELPIRLFDGQSRTVMTASNGVLLASGTATLEAMLLKKPMVVAYKVSKFSYFIYSKLLKIRSFSLPNLLSGRSLVKEYMQEQCTVENLTDGMRGMLEIGTVDSPMLKEFTRIHLTLRKGGSDIAAKAISELINEG